MPTELPLLALEETAGPSLGAAMSTRQGTECCFTCTFLHMLLYKRDPPAHSVMCLPLPSSAVYLGKSSVSFWLHFFKYCVYWRVLHWVVTAARGLSLARPAGTPLEWQCTGVSLWSSLLCRAQALRHAGFSRLAHGRSSCGCGVYCSSAYGIFPDQGAKRTSSLLARRFLNTGPLEKPCNSTRSFSIVEEYSLVSTDKIYAAILLVKNTSFCL